MPTAAIFIPSKFRISISNTGFQTQIIWINHKKSALICVLIIRVIRVLL